MTDLAVFLAILLGTAVSAIDSSEVNKTRRVYSCCGSHTLAFNPNCDCSWTVHGKVVAKFNSQFQKGECQDPCEAVHPGRLTLHQCPDARAECECEIGEFIEWETIDYHGELCSVSPHRSTYCGLVVLLMVLAFWWARC